jgi:alpha-beta hydrolase superfamily lysophospholipase
MGSCVAVQPIVIFGGFLSFAMFYSGMRDGLVRITGQPVWIVETRGHDWLPSITSLGWPYLLRKLDHTVRQAARESVTGRVTLIGHSAGGVLARLYLSPRPFLGSIYAGLDYVSQLITLGSPHHNQGKVTRGGHMSRWVERRYPGAYFVPHVKYASVAGRLIRGDRHGSFRERWAYDVYKEISGDGSTWGDGMIPVASALLHGAQHAVLEDVGHFSGFGRLWYGSQEIIPLWWAAVEGRDVSGS